MTEDPQMMKDDPWIISHPFRPYYIAGDDVCGYIVDDWPCGYGAEEHATSEGA